MSIQVGARSRPVRAAMESYFRDINETALLTADQEKELAYRIREGDVEARDHLVRANLRLVVTIARHFPGRGLSLADLIAEGNLGLLRAVEAYDPDMNTRFSTYAAYWIRQSMKRAVINTGGTIRIPAYMAQTISEWHRAAAALEADLGRTPTDEEIAGRLRIPAKKLRLIKRALRTHHGSPASGEGDQPLSEMVTDRAGDDAAANTFAEEDLRQILAHLDQLEPREAAVLRLRFGLDGEDPMTLVHIGERLGLTRERIRQIERDALRKLRDLLLT